MGTESKELHHKDEGCSIDNVAKVADNVVDIFKDSPRPRTAKVAIALQGWKMKSVGNQKWTTPPSDLSPSPLSPAWKPFGQMGWGRKLPGEEPNKDKPEIMFWNMLFRRIHPCLTLLILPWTSVCGARSRLTSWPGWSRAHLYCLLRSWNKHTLWNHQQISYSTNTKGFWLELQCWMLLFFTCEPRVCFYPLCSSPKFLRPVITQNNFTWLPSFSKPVSSGHFLDLDRSPPQYTIHAPPYKPGSQHERWKGWREGIVFYWTSPGFQTLSDSQTSPVELFPFSSNSVSPVVSILEQIAAGEWKTKSGRNMQTNNKRHKAKAQQSKYY